MELLQLESTAQLISKSIGNLPFLIIVQVPAKNVPLQSDLRVAAFVVFTLSLAFHVLANPPVFLHTLAVLVACICRSFQTRSVVLFGCLFKGTVAEVTLCQGVVLGQALSVGGKVFHQGSIIRYLILLDSLQGKFSLQVTFLQNIGTNLVRLFP